ncbi:MAG: hypothetical protein JSS81_24745 [Acidobacteria bacterium]|nr:hypothetical protein [Acidobacteriota bacterium]
MKYTAIILITLFISFSSAAAQESAAGEPAAREPRAAVVLADGHGRLTQSMVDRVVGFFEWSLDVELSDAQRAEFQREVVENWNNGQESEIRGVFYILELARELDHLDDARRLETRIELRDRFLEELEYRSSNRINALLLASYRERHGRIDNLSAAAEK